MQLVDQQHLQSGRQALQKAIALYLFDPNVTHIDLGLRIRDSADFKIENELTVRVHLRKKLRGDAFKAFADKFPDRVIDTRTIGFPVDVPEAHYRLHYRGFFAEYGYQRRSSVRRHYYEVMKGGIRISRLNSPGYGTLGGKVKDRNTGKEMLLSNWHVLAGTWVAQPGLPVYQPGSENGSSNHYQIGKFVKDAMGYQLDAAVAELNSARELLNEQLNIGPVSGVESPQLGQQLIKSGQGSGVTLGQVTGIEGQSVQRYNGIRRVIKNIIHIAASGPQREVSAPGDSGSWWIDSETRKAVGLHFAGSNSPEFALALEMSAVLNALNIDIGV